MTEDAPASAEAQQTAVHTFLIVDIRGYTRFTLEHGDSAAARLAAMFASLADEAVSANGGEVIELRGDEALAVFTSARQALRAAVALQERFRAGSAPDLPFQAGIGLDAGEALPVAGGYRGAALNLAARLCSLAGPGEILASDTVTNLARKLEGLEYRERGMASLKGFAEEVRVMEIHRAQQPSNQPAGVSPTRAETASGENQREEHLPIGGFLGSLPSGRLVGRDRELEQGLRTVDAVEHGDGRLLMLAGEPGAGKTRLGQELTLHLRNRGFLIAAGRCYEAETGMPYYPFLDALATLYRLAPAEVRREAPRRWPYLGALLPDQIGVPEVAGGGEDEQLRVFRAVTGFLEAITPATPVALLLDDLHWGDSASLKLLLYLARHTHTMPLLLLGTYRDVEIGRQHPLEAALHELSREGLAERIAVQRLPPGATRDLIAAEMGEEEPISDEFAQLVYGRTDGNPFFVQHVLRVLVERGDVFRRDGRWDRKDIADIEVPESVRAAIGQRLSRLSEETQAVLREAGVLGQTFTFDDLQAMSGRPDDALEAALEDAVGAGLVKEERGDGYAFDHALTQQALYQELPARRKRRLHLAAGEALETSSRGRRRHPAAELAWHFLQGDAPEQALRYSLQAGREAAAVFAHTEAEDHLRTALELAREMGDDRGTAEVLLALGHEMGGVARYLEARDCLLEAATLYRERGDAEGELETACALAAVERPRGEPQAAIDHLREVLARLDRPGREAALSRAYTALEASLFAAGQYAEELAAAQRAVELARIAGDEATLAVAEIGLGTALQKHGRMSDGIEILEHALPLADRACDYAGRARVRMNLASGLDRLGRFERSLQLSRETLAFVEPTSNPWAIAFTLSNLGDILMTLGLWDEARERLEVGAGLSREAGTAWWASYPLKGYGDLLLRRGERDGGLKALQQSLAIARHNNDMQALRVVQLTLAELDLAEGRPAEAIDRLGPLLDREGQEEDDVTLLLPALSQAHLDLGKLDEAERLLAQFFSRVEREGSISLVPRGLRVQAAHLARQGDTAGALAALDDALIRVQGMGMVPLEGEILLQRSRLLHAMGEDERARADREAAESIFQRLGAPLPPARP